MHQIVGTFARMFSESTIKLDNLRSQYISLTPSQATVLTTQTYNGFWYGLVDLANELVL